MAVIINDLEVELESPAAPAPPAAEATANEPTSTRASASPAELVRIFDQQLERLARIRAH